MVQMGTAWRSVAQLTEFIEGECLEGDSFVRMEATTFIHAREFHGFSACGGVLYFVVGEIGVGAGTGVYGKRSTPGQASVARESDRHVDPGVATGRVGKDDPAL